MKVIRTLSAILVLGLALAGLSGCEKGPAERAGENIDNAAKKAGDKMEDAGDKMKDAVK